jgi:L-lysine exporter family protein LysE/ArgO
MSKVFFEGVFLQAGLIFALGPQNIYVLESGLRRNHHLVVSFVCFFCDLFLILLGVTFTGMILNNNPLVKIILASLGVSFLIFQSLNKFKASSLRMQQETLNESFSIKNAIISSVLFSLLNPHAYIDALLLIGGYSSRYGDQYSRLVLGMGAATFSLIWFLSLALFASFLILYLKEKKYLNYSAKIFAFMLLFFALNLGMSVIRWTKEYLHS